LSIVQLVDSLDSGGLERVAVDLAIAHQAAGHRARFLCLHNAGELAPQAEAAGIPVEAFHKKRGLQPALFWQIAASLRRAGADVVHMHNPGVHLYGVLAAKLAGVKAILNSRHGTHTSGGQPFNERYFRMLLPLTGKVVYVSRASERYFVDSGIVPESKGVTVWNGIPLGAFLKAPVPRANAGSLRFVTAGRLVPVKGQATLIEAFAKVAAARPDASLRIWGEGELRGGLEALVARLGLAGRVHLPGATSNIAAALADADIFVFSSTSEGLPMVILEALGSGLAIVSTRVGGVPEVAPEGEVAWYCEPGDVAGLAASMMAAASSPQERARRGARARQLAVKEFSIEAAQRNYESVYRQLLKR
jgi:glycosyltransferase involved in cell wall biosynthesis